MILLLLSSLAYGEAQFTQLAEGEVAPFTGRLLNDEAITNIIIDQESIQESCQITVDYELEIAQAKWNYDFQIMKIGLEGKFERAETTIEVQAEEIDYLRQEFKPVRPFLWITTGFVVGTATSLGIYHSVKD